MADDAPTKKESLEALVTEAMFKHLSEEKREEQIKAALASLLEKKQERFGISSKTPLQEAFEQATWQAARKIIDEYITTNEKWREGMKKVVEKAFMSILDDEVKRSQLVTNMASALQSAFEYKER